ncbi:sensor histidine kinase [Brachybacterium muris]|uniref:sensor histidine kinase n=1 Tax=Brachybacterium muris TaxID=219301 RepID=UPI00223A6B89|nr:ATP-binding protein [Brachybacterium muris]MCT1653576.1 ATP-binding protein [Brachybacterium muris]
MPSTRPRRGLLRTGAGGWTVRTRVLSALLAFMVGGLAITGLLTYVAQFRVLEERITSELLQEKRELEVIAQSEDEDGTLVYETVDDLLATATLSLVPSDNESVLALIDGTPKYKPNVQDFELMDSPQALDRIREAHQPGSSSWLDLDINGTAVRALVVSVQVPGDPSEGIFVVASDIGVQKRALWRSVTTYIALATLTVITAGWAGYLVIGKLLKPLEALREATEEITVEDLEHRVPVPEGRDDIAALATNFNRMLERIQSGFAEQRRFMSDVGHELRTPLTIVRGTLEMTDPDDAADVRESHEIALDELDRMGRVVGDLSELAASARPDYVKPRPTDMAEFARSAFARIERIAERDWVLEQVADVVAEADEQRLTQAVVQLAANAVRYSEEGTRVVFSVARVLGAQGHEMHVSMRDQGVGIAPEDQLRIFERFARVDHSRENGSGLGLPIVLAIAEGHGGTVRLASKPGYGSTFSIVFPQFADGGDGFGDDGSDGEGVRSEGAGGEDVGGDGVRGDGDASHGVGDVRSGADDARSGTGRRQDEAPDSPRTIPDTGDHESPRPERSSTA